MSVISTVYEYDKTNLDDSVINFYETIVSEDLQTNYSINGWNSIKFNLDTTSNSLIENESISTFLIYTASSFKSNFWLSTYAVLDLTDIVWDTSYYTNLTPVAYENNSSDNIINKYALKITDYYENLITLIDENINISAIFMGTGFWMLCLFCIACSRNKLLIEKLLLIIPVFIYNIGTMLLLTGADSRFFAYTAPISIVLLFLLLSPSQSNINIRITQFIEKHNHLINQIIKFVLVSGIGWIIDILIFIILTSFFSINIMLSNLISSFVGVTYVYIVSIKNIFKNTKSSSKTKYIIYLIYQIVIITLNSFLIKYISESALLSEIYASDIISKLLTTPLTITVNFCFMKWLLEKLNK